MKVLIVTPSINLLGGVANFYKVLNGKFTLDVDYFIRGIKRDHGILHRVFVLFYYLLNVFQFTYILLFKKYNIIHLNTSLGYIGLIRDAIYLILAKLFNKKILVFFRGLDIKMQQKLQNSKLFSFFFFKADAIIVLSSAFKKKLQEWGYEKKIYLETTVIDDKWVNSSDLSFIKDKFNDKRAHFTILFVSRIIKEKGIYELLEGFSLLNKSYPHCKLVIVGDGKDLYKMKQYSCKKKIQNIEYTGYLTGKNKFKKFIEADVFILPSYTEGMPNVLIEAMALGLPVIASNVGGIPDLIKSEKFGYVLERIDPKQIKISIERILNNLEKRKSMAFHNLAFAQNQLTATKSIERLEYIYKKMNDYEF